jgi:hypothetical protein
MAPTRKATRLCGVLLALGAISALGACSGQPEESYNAIAVGSDLDFEGLRLRSISVVTAAENEPGRLLGTIFNSTGEEIEFVIRDPDNVLPLSVPANGQLTFDEAVHILGTTEDRPGARTDLTIEVKDQNTVLDVPVLDGTLEQFAPYVPTQGP